MTDPTLLRRAIESVGIEKPSDYTLVLEELERLMDEQKLSQHVEEIARAWASIDGKADKFDACKKDDKLEDDLGHYGGYVADTQELLSRSPATLRLLCGSSALIRAATDLVKEAEEMGFGKTSEKALPGSWDAMLKALDEVKK